MTSYEIKKLVAKIMTALKEKPNVMTLLSKASEYKSDLKTQMNQLIAETHLGEGMSLLSQLQSKVIEVYAANFRYASAREVFAELGQLQSDIKESLSNLANDDDKSTVRNSLDMLIGNIELFTESYNQFIATTSPSLQLVMFLIEAGDRLNSSIKELSNMSHLMRMSWHAKEIGPGYEVIDLLLPSASSYEDVLAKLTALDAIYSELCAFLGVSKSEYPLHVFKIETGSLWLWLAGNEIVVPLLVEVLKWAGVRFADRLTERGQIDDANKKAELIEKLWAIRDRRSGTGRESTVIDNQLNEVSARLISRSVELLRGEASFSINHEIYDLAAKPQGKQLQGGTPLLLEGSSDVSTS
jgi:hypothetical protein